MGTFDLFIWILMVIFVLLYIAQFAFYSQKAGDENKNRPILSIYTAFTFYRLILNSIWYPAYKDFYSIDL